MSLYIGIIRCTSLCRVICKALDIQEQMCCHMLALELLISADIHMYDLLAICSAGCQVSSAHTEHVTWQDMPNYSRPC